VHEFRKTFGSVPPEQKDAPWFKSPPPNPAVSDTKQIVKDTQRKQLTFSAPKAEGLSGFLDGEPMANLSILEVPGNQGFATVMAVTLDDMPLLKSKKILLSRTYTDASGKEFSEGGAAGGLVILKGLPTGKWTMKITRPARLVAEPQGIEVGADGALKLAATDWNECELKSP
jgi:hypothetical protein